MYGTVGRTRVRPENREFDPHASRIARLLALDAVPFGLRIDSGAVSMKAFLHGPEDALRLSGGKRAERTLAVANPRRLFRPDERALTEREVGR